MHMEGHARTWFTPKRKAELWGRWKSGQWVADVARALEERERCLRSWLSREELLQRHAGELRRVVLRRPVELTGGLCCETLFGGVHKIFQRRWCAHLKIMWGVSHDQSDFQPVAFASSLQGIGLPKTRFDGHNAKFCRHLIFEFCNTIFPTATRSLRRTR